MLGKRKAVSMIPPPKKRRKASSAIEEIAFDFSAREDYLTGFHKRKLQRIKHAKEEASKKEREEKINARKLLRDNRKADLEKHVEAVNSTLRDGDGEVLKPGEDNGNEDKQWDGMKEVPEIDHEAEYIDEDRFTTVTVEAVEISKDGLHRTADESEEYSEDGDLQAGCGRTSNAIHSGDGPETEKRKRVWTRGRPAGPKKKKKKFKYESKADRKATRHKERSKSKAKAETRRK